MQKIITRNSIVKAIIFGLITLMIFLFLFSRLNISKTAETFQQSSKPLLLLVILMTFLLPLIMARRWQFTLRAMGFSMPFAESLRITMAVWPLNSILPSKAGDALKAYCIKDKIPVTRSLGTILTERIFDLSILILYSAASLLFLSELRLMLIPLSVLAAIIIIISVSALNIRLPIKDKWQVRISNIFFSLKTFSRNKRLFAGIALMSFLLWTTIFIQTKLAFTALNISLPLIAILAYWPLSILTGMIPVTIAGMGTRDSAIILFFSRFASPEQLLSVAILYSFTGYWLLSAIGLPFMKRYI